MKQLKNCTDHERWVCDHVCVFTLGIFSLRVTVSISSRDGLIASVQELRADINYTEVSS